MGVTGLRRQGSECSRASSPPAAAMSGSSKARARTVAHAHLQGSGFRVQGSGFRVQGSGFMAQGSGFGVRDSGLRVEG